MRPNIIFFLLVFLCAKQSFSQSDVRTFDTMSFFYVDNSGDSQAKSLNAEAKKYLIEKLKAVQAEQNNFLYFYGLNGNIPVQIDSVNMIEESKPVLTYLSKPSETIDYETDRQQLISYFKKTPVNVTEQLNVYLFLSSKAIINMITGIETMPTPVMFPGELGHYIHADGPIRIKIYLVTNKDIEKKYNALQIARCFTFSDSGESDNYVRPVIEFK